MMMIRLQERKLGCELLLLGLGIQTPPLSRALYRERMNGHLSKNAKLFDHALNPAISKCFGPSAAHAFASESEGFCSRGIFT